MSRLFCACLYLSKSLESELGTVYFRIGVIMRIFQYTVSYSCIIFKYIELQKYTNNI